MSRDLVADVKRQQTQRGFSYDLDAQPFGYVNKAISVLIHLTSHRVHSVKQTSLTTISSRLTPVLKNSQKKLVKRHVEDLC